MSKRIITDEELRTAAREVLEYELAVFDSYHDLSDHHFHGEFRLNMAVLLHDVKRGAVKAATYSMGFVFYAKRCIAAMLLLFTLSCIAMPEAVQAGYHKLIEVIETVFEEYTEYRYRVNDDGGIEETFKPLKLGYLPEGMEEVRSREYVDSVDVLYMNQEDFYLNVYQKKIETNDGTVYLIDNGDLGGKKISLNGVTIQLIFEEKKIHYYFLHDTYSISGITNISEEELLIVIENIKLW